MVYDTLVIGAGQAGLAAGYYLQQAGLNFLILEAGDEPAGSWPHYYDSLILNSPAQYASLPGLPFPGRADRYPARDDIVAYLRRYAAHFDLPIRLKTRVLRVDHTDGLFRVLTNDGCYLARTVVAATGFFGRPHLPAFPGQERYRGQVLHVANYRRPEPFRGQRIVIVGGGNGAVQIGVELAEVADVTLAVRKPIRFLPQRLFGRDIHFWFRLAGLDRTQWRKGQTTPVYATETYRAAIAAGRPPQQPMFARFTEDGVVWSDGRHEAIDTVLLATGYRPNLDYLAALGALDAAGNALQRRGLSTSVPGLGYVGLVRQRNRASATLRGVGPDAKIVVDHLRAYCRARRRWSAAPLALWGWRTKRPLAAQAVPAADG
jgi:putative flavoprotein involved in K+ transport